MTHIIFRNEEDEIPHFKKDLVNLNFRLIMDKYCINNYIGKSLKDSVQYKRMCEELVGFFLPLVINTRSSLRPITVFLMVLSLYDPEKIYDETEFRFKSFALKTIFDIGSKSVVGDIVHDDFMFIYMNWKSQHKQRPMLTYEEIQSIFSKIERKINKSPYFKNKSVIDIIRHTRKDKLIKRLLRDSSGTEIDYMYPKHVWSAKRKEDVLEPLHFDCKDFIDKNPWFKDFLTFDYTGEQLDAIRMYTHNFDVYMNTLYRYKQLNYSMMIAHQNKYYQICNNYEEPYPVFSDRCGYENENADKFVENYKKLGLGCPTHILGERFYDLTTLQFERRIKQGIKNITHTLKNLSRTLKRTIPRPTITLYRGLRIKKTDKLITRRNFPTEIRGFTSCAYTIGSAFGFSSLRGDKTDFLTHQGIILEITITPDINIFTTDVMTSHRFESEIVITDRIKMIYDFKRARITYVNPFTHIIGERRFYEAIIVVPCKAYRI